MTEQEADRKIREFRSGLRGDTCKEIYDLNIQRPNYLFYN